MKTPKTTYTFQVLDDKAKARAIERLANINVQDDFWYECILDDIEEICKIIGIDLDTRQSRPCIYFSGFSSQGDGACFEGTYEYKRNSLKAIQEHAPLDTDLHAIVKDLFLIQMNNFFSLWAKVKHKGPYSHEYCTTFLVERTDEKAIVGDSEDNLIEILRRFMRWIYKRLEREYDYLTSEQAIIESIEEGKSWTFLLK